jgi:DNA-binding GntR family transcriptional regulator
VPKLREQAYDRFTAHLLRRELVPGQFVSQRELVQITGMSLAAIREMVPRLEADGLIVTVPQRGMQIAHLDLTLIRNAFQFRLFLEREAAAQFAQTASDERLAELRAAHEAVLAAAADGVDGKLVARAQAVDWGLHDAIIDALGNEIISNAYRVNSVKIRLIRQELTRLDEALVAPVMREHLGIVAALESRDPRRAADATAAHIENARNRALGLATPALTPK